MLTVNSPTSYCFDSLCTNTCVSADNFPRLVVNGAVQGGDWQYVRRTKNYNSNSPVENVGSVDIRCYSDGSSAQTYTVNAGATVGFTANSAPYHPGPLQFYMARAPGAVAGWDGNGQWFKIHGEGPTGLGTNLQWANNGNQLSNYQIVFRLRSDLTGFTHSQAATP
jgi:hypothetical protein